MKTVLRLLEKKLKQEVIHPKKSEKEVIMKALTIIEDRIQQRKLKQEKVIKPDKSNKDVIIRALTVVEERLKVRNMIIRFERCYGERPKKFFAFPPPSR